METPANPAEVVLEHNDPAVLKHVEMYQGIISRMVVNSSACKNWCIVLSSAFLAFAVQDGVQFGIILTLVPILIFWWMDAYYLALEQSFRNRLNEQMKKVHSHAFTLDLLFVVKTDGKIPPGLWNALSSHGTWPVYLALLVLNCIVAWFL